MTDLAHTNRARRSLYPDRLNVARLGFPWATGALDRPEPWSKLVRAYFDDRPHASDAAKEVRRMQARVSLHLHDSPDLRMRVHAHGSLLTEAARLTDPVKKEAAHFALALDLSPDLEAEFVSWVNAHEITAADACRTLSSSLAERLASGGVTVLDRSSSGVDKCVASPFETFLS